MSCTCYSLIFLLVCLAPLTFARTVRNRGGNSGTRNRRQNGSTQQTSNDQYSWVCPSVVCPSLPSSCQTIEFLIMEFEYTTESGQRATIRCESCDYCLDIPVTSESGRAKRSAQHRRHHDCSTVGCPDVPSNCVDIRMTDVLLGNTKCKQCPACYDETVFNRT